MKTIGVRFFAAFRDSAGTQEMNFETNAKNAGELYAELCTAVPGLAHEPNALVAINEEMARWSDDIADGDEVLLFPPVAGG